MSNKEQAIRIACESLTAYTKEGKIYSAREFLELHEQYPLMEKAILQVVPLLQKEMASIAEFIQNIPEYIQDHSGKEYFVCGRNIKDLFCLQLKNRLEHLLIPVYQQVFQKQ